MSDFVQLRADTIGKENETVVEGWCPAIFNYCISFRFWAKEQEVCQCS